MAKLSTAIGLLIFVVFDIVSFGYANSDDKNDIKTIVDNLQDTVEKQGHEIKLLKTLLLKQNEELNTQKNLLNAQNEIINEHKDTIKELKKTIASHSVDLERHDKDLQYYGSCSTIKSDRGETSKSETVDETKVDRIDATKDKPSVNTVKPLRSGKGLGFTAFFADAPVTKGDILKFTIPMAATGNEFNTNDGKFTASKEGLYAFFFVIECYPGTDVLVELVLNGNQVGKTHCNGEKTYATGSSLSVVDLNSGDGVWLRVDSGKGSLGRLTTFSGFLI